ncbi:MAG: EamA family transporter [Alcaligenaceae bacterium]|nr:EamA family transporter [Alcaligenaceae bacterium]
MVNASNQLKIGLLALIGGFISVAIGSSFAKLLFPSVGAAATAAYRLCIATLIITLYARPWRYKIHWQQLKWVLLYGMSLGGMNICFYFAIERIPIGIAVAVEFLGPLTLSMLSSRKKSDLIWVILAIAGFALLSPWKGASTSGDYIDPMGILFVMMSGTCWIFYIIFGQKTAELHASQTICYGLSVAALMTLPLVFLTSDFQTIFELDNIKHGVIIAFLSAIIPYSLDMISLRSLPRFLYSILLCMNPVISTLFAIFLLGEYLSLTQTLSLTLMIMACVGSSLSFIRQNKASRMNKRPILNSSD